MKDVGRALWLVALSVVLAATFLYDPSVATGGSEYAPDRVVNLQKLQFQLIMVHFGLALFVVGAAIHLAGECLDRLRGDDDATLAPTANESTASASAIAPGVVRGADGKYHVGFNFFDTPEEAAAFIAARDNPS